MKSQKRNRAFTLIELLIVIVIVAVLVGFAIPQYQQQIVKTRRTEGKAALLDLALRMERYYIQHQTFATATITDIIHSTQSTHGYYTLSIAAKSKTSYTLKATPNGDQAANDKACGSFSINEIGVKGVSGMSSVATCW